MRYFARLRPLIHARRTAVGLFGSLTVALGLTVVGTPAGAHPDRSTVLTFGKIRCEGPNSSPRQWELLPESGSKRTFARVSTRH